jgi:uncharacterized protein (DUF952 family)
MNYIYKSCDMSLWAAAEQAGRFSGAEIDLKDGFIHFSTADQLAETLRLHFAGRTGLCLITVDASVLEIKWEPARSGDLFPHLYDDLPLSAVRSVDDLNVGSDGIHHLPSQL